MICLVDKIKTLERIQKEKGKKLIQIHDLGEILFTFNEERHTEKNICLSFLVL